MRPVWRITRKFYAQAYIERIRIYRYCTYYHFPALENAAAPHQKIVYLLFSFLLNGVGVFILIYICGLPDFRAPFIICSRNNGAKIALCLRHTCACGFSTCQYHNNKNQ